MESDFSAAWLARHPVRDPAVRELKTGLVALLDVRIRTGDIGALGGLSLEKAGGGPELSLAESPHRDNLDGSVERARLVYR